VSVDVLGVSAGYSIKDNLESEFEGAKIIWDTNLYIITLDMDVEVIGDSACLNTTEPC